MIACRNGLLRLLDCALFVVLACNLESSSLATEVTLKDGRILRGKLGMVAGLADKPQPQLLEGGPIASIMFFDDDLRRTFVHRRQLRNAAGAVRQDDAGQPDEKFSIRQRVRSVGKAVRYVGPMLSVQSFDEFGRRIFRMNTSGGPVDVIQGITLLTPTYAKVEGISHVWDMRIATISIPRDILHKILFKQIDIDNVEHHKKIARFYLQVERYKEARLVLEGLLKAFPDDDKIKEQLKPTIRRLRQLSAGRILTELKLRRKAGQHAMVMDKLRMFPSEGVAGEILQEVREILQEYEAYIARRDKVVKQFETLLGQVKDTDTRSRIKVIGNEIIAALSTSTINRMAAFRQAVDDPDILPGEKLALALSGWVLGADSSTENLPVALSLYRVRKKVRKYLNEPIKLNRAGIFDSLHSEEGATVEMVAKMISHMKPPGKMPAPVSDKQPGYFEQDVASLPKEAKSSYLVQLPPEYDPYRRYPTIVTLHGGGNTAAHQIDWWAGARTKAGWRAGQASRQGYIVIAPKWTNEHQKKYHYSAREHAIVLNSLRDACRRFAIDTDRVFLSGHSIGGDAAWDIALAHPDLWAGVIPIAGMAERYCNHYRNNAKYLPFYVICGELDNGQLAKNAPDLEVYMRRYNCTVVEYLGRGHEHFYEEILRVFDWMGRYRRDFFPKKILCNTMRPWDNFFWWVEFDGMPAKTMIDPVDWPPRGIRAAQIEGRITATNGVNVNCARADRITVWLSPEMVDFNRRINVIVNTRRLTGSDRYVRPDLRVLLEDVRTRGERQHPFWARVE
jgi:predicted esterase